MTSVKPGTTSTSSGASRVEQLKAEVHRRLLDNLDMEEARRMPMEVLHRECTRRVETLIGEQRFPLSGPEKQVLIREIMDEVFGLGPIEELLSDPTISDILVNNPSRVYIERAGRLELTNISFRDADHLVQIIHRIAARVGRRIDESSPMLDARLVDGSRVNAIIPPLALQGPALSIRRFGRVPLDIDKLTELGTLTPEMSVLLEACVRARMNILISGGTGTGKTTLLNVLSRWIPETERVITIEDAAELQLQREHVVQLESRPPNIEGKGEITQRDLLRNTLRMRPDRIIIGEVRGAEALDMLQAMNTGHEGSMTTVHANTSRDALRRVENMVSMAGLNYPVQVIREQMASALNLVIHVDRVTGGQRKIVSISEVTGIERDVVCLQELFRFRQLGVDETGSAVGQYESSGVRPQLLNALQVEGIHLPPDMFNKRILDVAPSRARGNGHAR